MIYQGDSTVVNPPVAFTIASWTIQVLLLLTLRNSNQLSFSDWRCPSLMGSGEEEPVGKEIAISFLNREIPEGGSQAKQQ